MGVGLFPDIRKVLPDEDVVNGKTRVFKGTGKATLAVLGLLVLERVRIGRQVIPQYQEMEFPDNRRYEQNNRTELPLVMLTDDEDGTRVLVRSTLSNDGVWQEGADIYVTGEWDSPLEPPVLEPKKTKTA